MQSEFYKRLLSLVTITMLFSFLVFLTVEVRGCMEREQDLKYQRPLPDNWESLTDEQRRFYAPTWPTSAQGNK